MIRKLLFDMKSIWRCLALMAFISMAALLAVNHFQSKGFPPQDTIGPVLFQAQLILPAACAIPVAMLLYRRFDDGPMEVLHAIPSVCQTGARSVLLLEGVCLLLCLPAFIWYVRLYGVFLWQEWLRTMAQAFFLQNLAYAAVYLTHFHLAGIAAQVLTVGLLQYPLTVIETGNSLFQLLNIYETITPSAPRPWNPLRLTLVLICGILLWVTGAKREKFFLE